MADNKIIHSLLKEVRDDQKEANEKAQEFRERTLLYQMESNHRLDRYNDQLEVHIEGVTMLKTLHTDNVKRIERLEAPGKLMRFLSNKTVKLAGKITIILSAISGILALIELLRSIN